MKTQNNTGNIYEYGSRYGYGAVDYKSQAEGTGVENLFCGTTQKLGKEMHKHILFAQREELRAFVFSVLADESAHSEDLYLFTTNTKECYDLWIRPLELKLASAMKEIGAKVFPDLKCYDQQNFLAMALEAFNLGAEKYKAEFPDARFRNFSPLDLHFCALKLLQNTLIEYNVNGLV